MESKILRKKRIAPGKRLLVAYFPVFALVFVFSYLPMWGILMSFYDYKLGYDLSECNFVGLKHYTAMFGNPILRREMFRVVKNTLQYFLLDVIFSPLPLLFAVFLNEIRSKKLKKLIQTVTTIPNFISWVIVYALAFLIFSVDTGVVNKVLIHLGLIDTGISFLTSTKNVKLTMQLYATWKGLGWSSIIYLSGLSGINTELYEAASIDGAGRFQKMRYITIPGLMPIYVTQMILSIGSIINQGMDQFYVFENAFNKDMIETLDLYLYHIGIAGTNISYSIAMGQIKAFIGLGLMFYTNYLSKKIRGVDII